jgi:Avidin family
MRLSIFGMYTNQLGSKMILKNAGPGILTGTYQTNAGKPKF